MSLLSYNPQRLLTDQRTHEKKLLDALVQSFGTTYDDLLLDARLMLPSGEAWHSGGTVTGRWSGKLLSQPPKTNRYRKD